ncbi:hypothetical protein HN51_063263 [Arachis hypogaea]
MTLLLGPPGNGKTTLLLALTGRLDHSLKKVNRREKEAGIMPDRDLDAYMKPYWRSLMGLLDDDKRVAFEDSYAIHNDKDDGSARDLVENMQKGLDKRLRLFIKIEY